MEFKGTKGKWILNEKYQTIEDSEGYGIAQQNGIKNSEKWLEDSLLISKAPEMLEMLKIVYDSINMQSEIEYCSETYYKIEQLIKEATEL